jgi:hypothetical protein
MKRWFRRALRRCGIDAPFTDVVCPQMAKSIRLGEDTRIEVTVRRSLVFLKRPEPGDLRDSVPIVGDGDTVIHVSPDSRELHRTSRPKGTLVYWTPRDPIVPYALYVHQHGWSSAGSPAEAAVFTEFRCDMRTGVVEVDIVTPGRFEEAVAFKRPRWRRLATEQSLVKYALRQRERESERPAIAENGARLEWKLVGPKVGDRYVCVAFQQHGVALWEKRLKEATLLARARRLIRPLASA